MFKEQSDFDWIVEDIVGPVLIGLPIVGLLYHYLISGRSFLEILVAVADAGRVAGIFAVTVLLPALATLALGWGIGRLLIKPVLAYRRRRKEELRRITHVLGQ